MGTITSRELIENRVCDCKIAKPKCSIHKNDNDNECENNSYSKLCDMLKLELIAHIARINAIENECYNQLREKNGILIEYDDLICALRQTREVKELYSHLQYKLDAGE